ncbi:histidine phosphatase family protein [Paenibacillus sp. NEAU-GSW1]|uniref:histidine phosphatase family protein n=1 Tax=Paenibacillus sp. NEAU-GSW1 TaxID=2682486 RepID=UPI0020A6419A|nr:histidine phosphatase family protein [Paenibacillus sp. NEAU-GSW1]
MGLPLNEYGLEQAQGLRDELKNINFDFVFSSPQERAIQTAEIVTGLKATVDERLDVYDLGEADRVPINELKMSGPLPDTNVYKGVEDPNEGIPTDGNILNSHQILDITRLIILAMFNPKWTKPISCSLKKASGISLNVSQENVAENPNIVA